MIELNQNQISVLRFLGNNADKKFSHSELQAQGLTIAEADMRVLRQNRLVKGNYQNDIISSAQIDSVGKAYLEALQAKEAEKEYQREYDKQTLLTAKQANIIAIISMAVAVAALIVAVIGLFF